MWKNKRIKQFGEELDQRLKNQPAGSASPETRNVGEDEPLLSLGEQISHLRHNDQPADSAFQERLLSQLLDEHPAVKQSSMVQPPLGEFVAQFMRSRRWQVALAAFVLVAMVSTGVWYGIFQPGGPGGKIAGLFEGFSKLVISPAYAQDNFELVAEQTDSLGVSAETTYLLKSKEAVSTDLIRQNLKVEPEVKLAIDQTSPTEWRLRPAEPLAPNTILKVKLATSYVDDAGKQQARDYAWAFQVKDQFRVLHSIPRNAVADVPTDTGIEFTFSHDTFKDFDQYFSISPQVQGRFERHGRTAVFIPTQPLSEATVYTVTVRRGLPLTGSNETLNQEYVVKFETRTPQPYERTSFWFQAAQETFETGTKEPPLVSLFTSSQYGGEQVDQDITVKLFTVPGPDAFLELLQQRDTRPWWSRTRDQFRYDTSRFGVAGSFTVPVSQENYTSFIRFPEPVQPGFYVAELSAAGQTDQVLLQATDVAAYVNVARNSTVVWVNTIGGSGPTPRASVELFGLGTTVATDQQGVAVFPTPTELLPVADPDSAKPVYAKISAAGQSLVLSLSGLSAQYGYEFTPAARQADDFWHYMYTDRPRYQVNDTIKFWGILKDRGQRDITEPVTVALVKEGYVDYYYQPVKIVERQIELSPGHSYTGEFPLHNLKPDYYTLEMRVGESVIERKFIEIRPYIKPAYQLSLSPDRTVAFVGETINLKARASFFEGTPVPGLELVFETPGDSQTVTTNANGEVDLTYSMGFTPCDGNYSCWPRYASVRLHPAQAELADITAEANVRFFGPRVYQYSEVTYPAKGKAKVDLTAYQVDLERALQGGWGPGAQGEKFAPNAPVEGKVIKVSYVQNEIGTGYDFINKRSYPIYQYSREEKEVDSFSGRTDAAGKYSYERSVEPYTSYQVILKVLDAQGQEDVSTQWLYYYDGAELNRYLDYGYNLYHFELPENKRYSVGETVPAAFKRSGERLPESGDQRYLYLQYQNGYQEHQVSASSLYSFRFEERDVPNVNLVGVYFNGVTYVATEAGFLSQGPVFNLDERNLDIKVSADKATYKPGEEVRLSVEVRDVAGRGRAAELNLNVVDEAYYAVVGDAASPLGTLYTSLGTGSLYANYSHRPPTTPFGGAEKGGGGGDARQLFVDTALFQTIRTGGDGRAQVTFKLPDNITSWRVTAQAVTDDMFAGATTEKVPVSLPVFAEVSAGSEFVLADKPVVRLRAFGSALTEADNATFTVAAPSLGLESSEPLITKAFLSTDFTLPALQLGRHLLTYALTTPKGDDAVRLPIDVLASRLQKVEATSQRLTTESKISTPNNEPAVVVLSDIGQNQLYPLLQELSWSWGDRVDQGLARTVATELLNTYYSESWQVPNFEGYRYQTSSGGLTLLPYSSEDVALSARLAGVAPEKFDQAALQQFLFGVLENPANGPTEVSAALYGLAALRQPVLPRLQAWAARSDLSATDRLFTALGFAAAGDVEQARKQYRSVVETFAEAKDPYIIIRVGDDSAATLQATALAAMLAARINAPERDGYWAFLTSQRSTEVLLNLEQLAYAINVLPQLKPSPARVVYTVGGKRSEVRLTGGQIHAFQLEPQQFGDVQFTEIEGDVGLSVRFVRPATSSELKTDADTSISRGYFVNGRSTSRFSEGDLIEVRIQPSFNDRALEGEYQITDILPSGFVPVTNLYQQNYQYECNVWYPYDTDGQRVHFRINKWWRSGYCGEYFKYYARVKAKGSYVAEPAVMQSFVNPDFVTSSNSFQVTIE